MMDKPPDFSSWTTGRIWSLLDEYWENLPAMRTLYGRNAEETENLQLWIDAMEKELSKRAQTLP